MAEGFFYAETFMNFVRCGSQPFESTVVVSLTFFVKFPPDSGSQTSAGGTTSKILLTRPHLRTSNRRMVEHCSQNFAQGDVQKVYG